MYPLTKLHDFVTQKKVCCYPPQITKALRQLERSFRLSVVTSIYIRLSRFISVLFYFLIFPIFLVIIFLRVFSPQTAYPHFHTGPQHLVAMNYISSVIITCLVLESNPKTTWGLHFAPKWRPNWSHRRAVSPMTGHDRKSGWSMRLTGLVYKQRTDGGREFGCVLC